MQANENIEEFAARLELAHLAVLLDRAARAIRESDRITGQMRSAAKEALRILEPQRHG